MKFTAALATAALFASPAIAGLCSAPSNFDAKLLNTKYTITLANGRTATDAAVSGEMTVTGACTLKLSPVTIANLGAGKSIRMIAKSTRDPAFAHTISPALTTTNPTLDVTLPSDTRPDNGGSNYGLSYNDFDL